MKNNEEIEDEYIKRCNDAQFVMAVPWNGNNISIINRLIKRFNLKARRDHEAVENMIEVKERGQCNPICRVEKYAYIYIAQSEDGEVFVKHWNPNKYKNERKKQRVIFAE